MAPDAADHNAEISPGHFVALRLGVGSLPMVPAEELGLVKP